MVGAKDEIYSLTLMAYQDRTRTGRVGHSPGPPRSLEADPVLNQVQASLEVKP